MKITAITKFKHGELHAILKKLRMSQAELARRTGIRREAICRIVNLTERPNQSQAEAIQKALAEAGEYLDIHAGWPDGFRLPPGFATHQTQEILPRRLDDCADEVLQLTAPEIKSYDDLHQALQVASLTEIERGVIEKIYFEGQSCAEIARIRGVTRQSIKITELRALEKLRKPSCLRLLKNI